MATDRLGLTDEYEHKELRLKVCSSCAYATWMSKTEYSLWLAQHGIAVLKNADQLETLPPLPRFKLSECRQTLFCRLCKCNLEAKAGVPENECIYGLWDFSKIFKKGKEL